MLLQAVDTTGMFKFYCSICPELVHGTAVSLGSHLFVDQIILISLCFSRQLAVIPVLAMILKRLLYSVQPHSVTTALIS